MSAKTTRSPVWPPLLPDLAGIYCLAVFLALLPSGGRALSSDTLWHIRAGAEMIERGKIFREDVFSHTVSGQPWTAHEWLTEIIMALLHRAAGLEGVVIFFLLVAALTFWMLFRAVRQEGGNLPAVLTVSLALALSHSHLLARPHLISWLLGVVTLSLLLRGGRLLYLLPLLTMLWVNLHGGFILGLVLQGLFLAASLLEGRAGREEAGWKRLLQKERPALAALLLSIAAVGVSPFGYGLLLFPFQASTPVFAAGIVEWQSPDMRRLWHFRFTLLALLFLLTFGRYRCSWNDRLFLLFFVNAALVHQRNMSVAGIFLAPFLSRALALEAGRFFPRGAAGKERDGGELLLSPASGPILTILLALLLLGSGVTGRPAWQRLSGVASAMAERYPAEAVAHLERHRPPGKMFNEYAWGGYLLYATDLKVFIDGRADMYGEELFGDYEKIIGLDKEAESLLSKYGIDWVFYPVDHALVRCLKAGGRWTGVYEDEKAAVLVRRERSAGAKGHGRGLPENPVVVR